MQSDVLRAIFLLLLIPAAGVEGVKAQDPAGSPAVDIGAVRAWIRDHAVALTTVEAGSGFSDLQRMRDIVGDARIVALG